MKLCRVCGKQLNSSRAKTCSDKCRQKLSRRRTDNEHRMWDVREKLRKLNQAYSIGAIDDEFAEAAIDYIQRELDKLKLEMKVKHARATRRGETLSK